MADRRVTWPDVGLTVLLLFIGLLGTGPAAVNQGRTAPVLSYVLVVAACLPIAAWRWRPMWTFILTGAATMIYMAIGFAYGPIQFAMVVAIVGLSIRSPIRQAALSMALLLAASTVAVGAGVALGERDWQEFISVAGWLVIPAAVGMTVKVRRDATAAVRAEQARRAFSEERLQLAQEVHDVIGHGLAVIAMQAGVALRVLDRDPGGARAALEGIRATSREALDGLRAEVEALRHRSGQPDAPLRPNPGLGDLARLAERMRSSGLVVAVDVDEKAIGLPADVDRAAYRIVRESLTNVLRHGGPAATARVRILRDNAAVSIEVLDTGRGDTARSGDGRGIEGMRTRSEVLGGTLEAGPDPHGGFAVRARLPIADRTPAPKEYS